MYLLFSEGYYSESHDNILREDLCLEAMRLAYLLIENKQTNTPAVNALLSLMCFHASRFKARKNEKGEIVFYGDQDETLWNYELNANETSCAVTVTSNDSTTQNWEVVNNHLVRLKQIRLSNGMARVYMITVTCTDAAGNTTKRTTGISVAKNISPKK